MTTPDKTGIWEKKNLKMGGKFKISKKWFYRGKKDGFSKKNWKKKTNKTFVKKLGFSGKKDIFVEKHKTRKKSLGSA